MEIFSVEYWRELEINDDDDDDDDDDDVMVSDSRSLGAPIFTE